MSYSALICKSIKALLLAGYCSVLRAYFEKVSIALYLSHLFLVPHCPVSLSHRLAFPISRAQSRPQWAISPNIEFAYIQYVAVHTGPKGY